ncbi:MAG: hypothetical protein E7308_00140 [Butyrivibrio sp.]|jgi:hypothetical protein|nr:hypothetical protein [Butyrivibrio sp.]
MGKKNNKKNNILENAQALTDEELDEVTGGFSLWDWVTSFFTGNSIKPDKNVLEPKAGLTRNEGGGLNKFRR